LTPVPQRTAPNEDALRPETTRLPRAQTAKWHVKMFDDYEGFCGGVYNDPTPPGATGTHEFVNAKMQDMGPWAEAFEGVDSVMHLQAWNPYPEATWDDSRLSMDITCNAISAAAKFGVRRFIFASSNHVFGRYWREGATLSESGKPIDRDTLVNPGTQFRVPSFDCDATPYAAAKLAGECALRAASDTTEGFSGISLRIGWCQPGENMPDTMSATGTPSIADDAEDADTGYSEVALGFDDEHKILPWFENSKRRNGPALLPFLPATKPRMRFRCVQCGSATGICCRQWSAASTTSRTSTWLSSACRTTRTCAGTSPTR